MDHHRHAGAGVHQHAGAGVHQHAGAGEAHSDIATIRAMYPRARGTLALRGSAAGLDWKRDRAPDEVAGDTSIFRIPVPHGETVEIKVVRHDGAWMIGRNLVVACGDDCEVRPSFDRRNGMLGPRRTISIEGAIAGTIAGTIAGYGDLTFRVMLPPSYDEQVDRRYPVLYAQDGQSLWSDGHDPFGLWRLDNVVDELWEIGALDEIIVVGLETGERRLERLGPVPDPRHGGGGGDKHLAVMVDVLKPLIDRELRTRPGREHTALMGSSMGGLFSFWAAWTRPDVFGAAICLSSSFWWADRFAIRLVQHCACPAPRPRLYLDSGVAASQFEEDASTRDGVHNTRTMYRTLIGHCYEPHQDLDVLAFLGHRHDPASWAGRVAVPLQMAFPRQS